MEDGHMVWLISYLFLRPPESLGWCLCASSLINNHVTQKWMFQVKAP